MLVCLGMKHMNCRLLSKMPCELHVLQSDDGVELRRLCLIMILTLLAL